MLIRRMYDTITLEEARDLIAKEGKLAKGQFYNTAYKLRCALGVLGDFNSNNGASILNWSSVDELNILVLEVTGFNTLMLANDSYKGSTSGRCKFMVDIFNQLIEYENRGK